MRKKIIYTVAIQLFVSFHGSIESVCVAIFRQQSEKIVNKTTMTDIHVYLCFHAKRGFVNKMISFSIHATIMYSKPTANIKIKSHACAPDDTIGDRQFL